MAGNGLMLPRNPLPNAIARGFKDKVPACTFASNPCRIKFYTQELVFHRDDVCAKMRKYSRKPSGRAPPPSPPSFKHSSGLPVACPSSLM